MENWRKLQNIKTEKVDDCPLGYHYCHMSCNWYRVNGCLQNINKEAKPMSKAKDRARAELGTIFRDGKLVNKEDWYKVHPTREMKQQQQNLVDEAVAKVKATKNNAPYFCTKCNCRHIKGKLYNKHLIYAREEIC